MPMYDVVCLDCRSLDQRLIKSAMLNSIPSEITFDDGIVVPVFQDLWRGDCDSCGSEQRVLRLQVPLKSPVIHADARNYDAQIAKMKTSFDNRFVRSGEMDQVRHKFGNAFDESLVAAAAGRIRAAGKTK